MAADESDGNISTFDLNVGGTIYTSTVRTLTEKCPNSKLARLVTRAMTGKDQSSITMEDEDEIPLCRDSQDRVFFDRDGASFRYVLDYLRRANEDTMAPVAAPTSAVAVDGLSERHQNRSWLTRLVPVPSDRYRLHQEAEFYGLESLSNELRRIEQFVTRPVKPARSNSRPDLMEQASEEASNSGMMGSLKPSLKKTISLPQPLKRREPVMDRGVRNSVRGSSKIGLRGAHYITIGFRSSYDTSRDVPANDITRFRRVNRITVAGRSDVAQEVFQEDLNDSRDPDRSPDGYTCRYYLKHNYLELAFDTLSSKGFVMLNSYMLAATSSQSNSNSSYAQCEAIFFKPASV